MGGYGSGNRGKRRGSKHTVADCSELAIAEVKQHITHPGADTVTFHRSFVRCSETKLLGVSYNSLTFRLGWTACNYGSMRPWFKCPKCDRRVANLYQPVETTRFSSWQCRHCLNLSYDSSQKAHSKEAIWYRRQQAIAKFRKAIGNPNWHPSRDGYAIGAIKPKGMHWKTFERLARAVDAIEVETLEATMPRLKQLCGISGMPDDLVTSIRAVTEGLETATRYLR